MEENFSRVWSEINNVIKEHITEMHLKFELQFSVMAREVRKRDEIIANLQTKIRNIELKSSSPRKKTEFMNQEKLNTLWDDADPKSDDHGSSSSSAELLFMRGDSSDTVFLSSPPQIQRYGSSPIFNKFYKNSSGYISTRSLNKNKSAENIAIEKQQKGNYIVTVSDVTGNLKKPDSVVLDIGDSSSSSSSSTKLNVKYEDSEQKNVESVFENVHHNDWELKMLAVEMAKQERKRANSTDFKYSNSTLRRRRKFSDTETDISEADADAQALTLTRPRASSLDQFNLRYGVGKGVFKAISIDRDKNKL